MAQIDPLTDLAFELERFDWTDDRLEVVGRWFGVRGHRFIRPTLHLKLGDRRQRLIALLDDKPWAADGEGAWTAAFAWTGEHDGVTAARLEVAPDVILDLPSPGHDAAGASLTPRPRPRRPKAAPKADAPVKKPAKRKPPAAPKKAAKAKPPTTPATPPEPAEPAAVAVPAEPASPPPAVAVPVEPASPPPAAIVEPPRPAAPAHAPSSMAGEIATLALERRLVEERAERERLGEELEAARREIASLSSHHASAVERSREVVELEGQLAVANARAEAAESRAAHLQRDVAPLQPRVERRRGSQQWGARTQIAAIAAVAVVLVVLALIIL
jgi:hypothetical protein